jgi:hypothetical protein
MIQETDECLANRLLLSMNARMELLDLCLRTTYFQIDYVFCQIRGWMVLGFPLSPVIRNILKEDFEKLYVVADGPETWNPRSVDDTFAILPHSNSSHEPPTWFKGNSQVYHRTRDSSITSLPRGTCGQGQKFRKRITCTDKTNKRDNIYTKLSIIRTVPAKARQCKP